MSDKKPWWNPLEPFAAPTPAEQTASQLLHDKLGVKPAPFDPKKEYLGDGVYVALDSGGGLFLTTENGVEATNTIYIEHDVLRSFERWLVRVGWRC